MNSSNNKKVEARIIGRTVANVLEGKHLPLGGTDELAAAIKGALGLSLSATWEEIISKYEERKGNQSMETRPTKEEILASENKFWIIWTETGTNPRYCHTTYESADVEARKLALSNPGKKFYVMQAVRSVCLGTLLVQDLETEW